MEKMSTSSMMPRRGFADVAGGQVHYWEGGRGDGLPLIMLHPSPGSARMLRPLLSVMAANRRVIALDTGGNGDSSPLLAEQPEIADFAHATLEAIDALAIDRFMLFGSHTGASIAAEIAIQAPQRVGRLVLESMGLWDATLQAEHLAKNAPNVEPDSIGSQLNWAWHYCRDQHLFWPWYDRRAEARLTTGLPEPSVLHELVVGVRKAPPSYRVSCGAAPRYPKRDRLPLIRVPTLVASAELDPLHRYLDEMHRLVPASQRALTKEVETPQGLAKAARAYSAFLDQG
jgi:pimeloyl-ACP methyl ester carboxylesterase